MSDIGKALKDEMKRVTARQLRSSVGTLAQEVRGLRRKLSHQERVTSDLERRIGRLLRESDGRRMESLKATHTEVTSARIRPQLPGNESRNS